MFYMIEIKRTNKSNYDNNKTSTINEIHDKKLRRKNRWNTKNEQGN